MLFVTQDFATIACQSMRTLQTDFIGALRDVTRQLSALGPLAASEAAARISISENDTVHSVATRLMLTLGLALDDVQLEAACSVLSNGDKTTSVGEAQRLNIERAADSYRSRDILLPHELIQLKRLEESYLPLLEGKAITSIDIPTEMLIRAEPPHPHLEGTIDLLGPSRILTFGPTCICQSENGGQSSGSTSERITLETSLRWISTATTRSWPRKDQNATGRCLSS